MATIQERRTALKFIIEEQFGILVQPGAIDALLYLIDYNFDNLGGVRVVAEENHFESESARDTYFSANLDDLVTGLPVTVQTGTQQDPAITFQIWSGTSSPLTYDNTLWADAGVMALTTDQMAVLLGLIGVSDTYIPRKDGANSYVDSAIRETADRLISTKSLEVPNGTIYIGPSSAISNGLNAINFSNSNLNIASLILSQQYTTSGGVFTKTLEISAQDEVDISTSTGQTSDTAQFTLTSTADEIITHLKVLTTRLSEILNFEVTVRLGSHSGTVIYNINGQIITDSSGMAEQQLTNPILVDTGTTVYVTVNCEDMSGTGTGASFIPRSSVLRQVVVKRDIKFTRPLSSQSSSFTVNSSNINEFVNGGFVFTNSTGNVDLNLGDDLFSEGDELIVKHSNQNGTATIIPHTGGGVDGQSSIVLSAFDSYTLKYTSSNNWLVIASSGVSQQASFSSPVLSSFSINIPSRVDLNTNLNQEYTINFEALHVANLQSLELTVIGGDNINLSVPSSDGLQSDQVTLTGIETSSNTTLTFRLTGVDTRNNSVQSNAQNVSVRNAVSSEFIYYGIGNIDPVTVDVGTLSSQEVTGAGQFNVSLGPSSSGDDIVFLVPVDRDIAEIQNRSLSNINVISSYTKTINVRQINSINYNSYELANLNSGLTFNYTIIHS